MTAAEQALIRMKEKIQLQTERHRKACDTSGLNTAFPIAIYIWGLYAAAAILEEEIQKGKTNG